MIVFADHLAVFAGVLEMTKRRAPGSIVPPRGARPTRKSKAAIGGSGQQEVALVGVENGDRRVHDRQDVAAAKVDQHVG